jgi:anti-sigma regulatory factor (Ser/Thr protein kinase)
MFKQAQLKLALWYAGALGLTILVIGTVAFVAVRRSMDDEINDSIALARAGLAGTDVALTNGPPVDTDRARESGSDEERATTLQTDVFFLVTDGSGTVLSNPRRVSVEGLPLGALVGRAAEGARTSDVRAGGHHYRILSEAIGSSASPSYLHIGRSLDARDSQLRTLTAVLVLGGLVGVVVSGIGGLWLANRALVPIQQSLETQRRFVSDASHELRTPIAVVKANNELLLRHPEATIESSLDQVEAVAAEADQMARLVEDLLTLARADEGRATLHFEPLDFGALVDEVGRDMAALAELREISLQVETQPAEVEGDRQRLRQLTVILVDNALKYTPAGGSVVVRVGRSGRRAELSVRDTGPGIAAEHQRRVFDRFYRVDAARTRAVGGTGLGLPIARWITEAHEGRLTLESVPGKGSTFTVRLPARG